MKTQCNGNDTESKCRKGMDEYNSTSQGFQFYDQPRAIISFIHIPAFTYP